ncbi:MAG TPA: response regulator transcription factor [Candidatus Methylomirabilis sp.]|jgi:two-component system response regulator NreC
MTGAKRIRILLADDHAVLRAGLRALLAAQDDLEVVGEASDGAEAIRLCQTLRPDVVVMDIGMPGVSGIDATARIKRDLPGTKVLILSMHDDRGYLRQVLRVGASGYVLKKAADTELLAAIRAAARGEVFLDPTLAKALVDEVMEPKTAGGEPPALSHREREVLRLLAHGHTNQQVADRLCISVKSVETYKARLMEKLGLKGRAELVRHALQHGLLKDID